MPKVNRANARKTLSFEAFLSRHQREVAELRFLFPRTPEIVSATTTLADALGPATSRRRELPPLMRELKNHAVIKLLAAAKRENSPYAFSGILYWFLHTMGVRPPEGVLGKADGPPGRPEASSTKKIHAAWLKLGKVGGEKLARAVYGRKFTNADAADRKRMKDQCWAAVRRHEAARATK